MFNPCTDVFVDLHTTTGPRLRADYSPPKSAAVFGECTQDSCCRSARRMRVAPPFETFDYGNFSARAQRRRSLPVGCRPTTRDPVRNRLLWYSGRIATSRSYAHAPREANRIPYASAGNLARREREAAIRALMRGRQQPLGGDLTGFAAHCFPRSQLTCDTNDDRVIKEIWRNRRFLAEPASVPLGHVVRRFRSSVCRVIRFTSTRIVRLGAYVVATGHAQSLSPADGIRVDPQTRCHRVSNFVIDSIIPTAAFSGPRGATQGSWERACDYAPQILHRVPLRSRGG